MEDKSLIEIAKNELLMSINSHKSFFFKMRAKELFKLSEADFYNELYEYYKKLIDVEMAQKLDEIDNRINDLFLSLKANFGFNNNDRFGLQFLGERTLVGRWVDQSIEHDGYFSNYYYSISYYPEVGFVEEGNEEHSTEGYTVNVEGRLGGKYIVPSDERRNPLGTVNKFMEENKEKLEEIHKALLQKIQIITTFNKTIKPEDREVCQKINNLFATAINSIKRKEQIIEDNKEQQIRM